MAFSSYSIWIGCHEYLIEKSHSACEAVLEKKWRLCSCSFKKIPVIKSMEKGCGSIFAMGLKKIFKKFKETDSFEMKSKITLDQELLPSDLLVRHIFFSWNSYSLGNGHWMAMEHFVDRRRLFLSGFLNTQNCRIWTT